MKNVRERGTPVKSQKKRGYATLVIRKKRGKQKVLERAMLLVSKIWLNRKSEEGASARCTRGECLLTRGSRTPLSDRA